MKKVEHKTTPLKVVHKEMVNHDVCLLVLEFPHNWKSGVWAGGHFTFHATINGKEIERRYSQISPVSQKNSAVFAIKIYEKTKKFPNGGIFT